MFSVLGIVDATGEEFRAGGVVFDVEEEGPIDHELSWLAAELVDQLDLGSGVGGRAFLVDDDSRLLHDVGDFEFAFGCTAAGEQRESRGVFKDFADSELKNSRKFMKFRSALGGKVLTDFTTSLS